MKCIITQVWDSDEFRDTIQMFVLPFTEVMIEWLKEKINIACKIKTEHKDFSVIEFYNNRTEFFCWSHNNSNKIFDKYIELLSNSLEEYIIVDVPQNEFKVLDKVFGEVNNLKLCLGNDYLFYRDYLDYGMCESKIIPYEIILNIK